MPANNNISLPAGYAPAFAIGYSDQSGNLAIVESASPLPVSIPPETTVTVQQANTPAPAPLVGQTTLDLLAGPFVPVPGRPVILTLSGGWQGSVQVERSFDSGASRHPLTVAGIAWGEFSANACEPVWIENEDGAELYLDIVVSAGTLDYRLAQ